MDLRLSNDPYESFRVFQGQILEQYLAMSTEFKFVLMDANQPIEAQQSIARELVSAKIDLSAFSTESSHAQIRPQPMASVGPIPSTI